MKKLLKFGTLFGSGYGLCAKPFQAFNSVTHIFIAETVFPFSPDKIDLYCGGIAPDLSMYIPMIKRGL